jgi:hypothetical protein
VTRILLLAALALFVVVALRRAFAAGRASTVPPQRPRGPGAPRDDARPRSGGSPQQLVCGACGHDFDPEESGWICPRCGK